MQLTPRLAGKIDLSGVVQQTVWEAAQSQSPEGDENAWLAWLRCLLAHNLQDEIRKAQADCRDLRREQSLQADLDASSARLEACLAAQQSSPSSRLSRAEELNRLALALGQLADDQRLAIELHHLQGLPLATVAEKLGRSKEAVASLLYRSLKRLRKQLDTEVEE